jgi:hypothetical protein
MNTGLLIAARGIIHSLLWNIYKTYILGKMHKITGM